MTKPANLVPRLSEKTYSLSQNRVYVVDVNRNLNKLEVKRAIEGQFSVKVASVNLANISGKSKRTVSKGGRKVAKGSDQTIKKAYITLLEGNSLPFFAAIEEEEKQSEKIQAELAKKQAKDDAKEINDDESKPKHHLRRSKTAKETK